MTAEKEDNQNVERSVLERPIRQPTGDLKQTFQMRRAELKTQVSESPMYKFYLKPQTVNKNRR